MQTTTKSSYKVDSRIYTLDAGILGAKVELADRPFNLASYWLSPRSEPLSSLNARFL